MEMIVKKISPYLIQLYDYRKINKWRYSKIKFLSYFNYPKQNKIICCWYKKTSFNSKQNFKKEKQIQAQKQSTTMLEAVYNTVF